MLVCACVCVWLYVFVYVCVCVPLCGSVYLQVHNLVHIHKVVKSLQSSSMSYIIVYVFSVCV